MTAVNGDEIVLMSWPFRKSAGLNAEEQPERSRPGFPLVGQCGTAPFT